MKSFVALVTLDGSAADAALLRKLAEKARLPSSTEATISIDGACGLAEVAHVEDRQSCLSGQAGSPVLHVGTPEHPFAEFSFARWDTRTQTLHCARDRFGVLPLYYARTANAFIASDSLESVIAHPGVDTDTLDDGAVADYLDNGVLHDAAATIYANVRRLPPAHTLTLARDGALTIQRYWTLDTHRPPVRGDAVGRLDNALREAIADRVNAPTAIVFLSGGVDSSALAALTREVRPDTRLIAATSVYRSRIADVEESFALEAARSIGIESRVFALDGYAPLQAVRDGVWTAEPGPLLSAPMTRHIYAASAALAPIALHGHPADALLSADPLPFLRTLGPLRLLAMFARYTKVKRKLPWFYFRELFGVERAKPPVEDRSSWLRPELAERLRARSTPDVAVLAAFWSNYFEWAHPLQTRAPIALVYPWCDPRVVDAVLSMETVPWLIDKHVVRELLRGRVSERIRTRPKTYLGGDPWTCELPEGGVTIEASARYIDPLRFGAACGSRPLADTTLRAAAFEYWLRELPARVSLLRA